MIHTEPQPASEAFVGLHATNDVRGWVVAGVGTGYRHVAAAPG